MGSINKTKKKKWK